MDGKSSLILRQYIDKIIMKIIKYSVVMYLLLISISSLLRLELCSQFMKTFDSDIFE